MKASGISIMTLMRPLMLAAVILTGVMILFNNYVLPDANHLAKNLLLDIGTMKPAAKIIPGMFVDDIENYRIIVKDKDDLTGELHRASGTLYRAREGQGGGRLADAVRADEGDLGAGGVGHRLSGRDPTARYRGRRERAESPSGAVPGGRDFRPGPGASRSRSLGSEGSPPPGPARPVGIRPRGELR